MHRLLLSALTVLMLVSAAPSQSLAHSIPADTLVYLRSWSGDPVEAIKKMFSGGGMYSEPIDVDGIVDMMDDALQEVGDMMDLGNISLSKWLRSIHGYEAALTRFQLMDGFPEMDFVIVMKTSMAEEIYKVVSGKLVEEAVADEVSKDEMEISFGEFSMNVGRHDDKIIVASDQRQLRETMKTFGSVKAGCLAQSKTFKRVMGSDDLPKECIYVSVQPWLKIFMEEMASSGYEGRDAAEITMRSLGLFKLGAIGWNELEHTTHIALVADEAIPALEILDCGKGGHEELDVMPSDVAVAVTWNGSADALWKKGTAFLLDETKFPLAPMLEQQLVAYQKQLGVRLEEIAAIATGGISFAFMPDANGRLDDQEENFFVAVRTHEPEKAQATIADLITKVVEPRGGELVVANEGERTWFRLKMPNERTIPCLAFDGRTILIGVEEAVRKALGARTGKTPTLARYGVCKGLPQRASAYVFVGFKPLMSVEDGFAPAYSGMRDGAGISAAVNIDPDRIVIRTSKPVSQAIGAVGVAAAMHERQRADRRAIEKDLQTIATAYREYKALHGKDPASLGALGFTGDKALSYPPNRAANVPGKPYKLVSTEGADPDDARNTIVVICPDSRFGRLVGTLEGGSRSLSESRFRRQFQKQRLPK